ncbi:hypothetical protein [Pseudoalteromonas phenolica]|nr:hypothetical protein [Pseudoalteromonas phenolica]
MKKTLLAISLFLTTYSACADYDKYWLEVSEGLQYGATIKLKVRDNDKGWALVHSKYTEE